MSTTQTAKINIYTASLPEIHAEFRRVHALPQAERGSTSSWNQILDEIEEEIINFSDRENCQRERATWNRLRA